MKSPRILWVNSQPPLSRWTYSGGSRELCDELARRDLLHAALAPDFISRTFQKSPPMGLDFCYRLSSTFPKLFPREEVWASEESGSLWKAIQSLPEDSAIVYVFDMPRISSRVKHRRFLFLDISSYEARRAGAFVKDNLSEAEFREICNHQKEILSHADGVITPSTFAADSISRDFGYPRNQITAFGLGAAMPSRVLKANTHCPDPPNVLFVGRDWERKGGPLVYRAWQLLRQRVPEVILSIVGPSVRPLTEDGVRFVGFVDKTSRRGLKKLAHEFASATLFCMPTLCEPWGLVFVEAMHFGLPIVSFSEWSLPDIVKDGVTGRLAKQCDAESLCEAMFEIISNRTLESSMRMAALQRAQNILSWPACVDRLLHRIIPNALGGRKPVWMQGISG